MVTGRASSRRPCSRACGGAQSPVSTPALQEKAGFALTVNLRAKQLRTSALAPSACHTVRLLLEADGVVRVLPSGL
jgi:hypothetical protein